MKILLTLLACTCAVLSATGWYASWRAYHGGLTFPPINAAHMELLGLGFALTCVLCLVGIGILSQLEVLVDYAASTWRLTVDDHTHASTDEPEGDAHEHRHTGP